MPSPVINVDNNKDSLPPRLARNGIVNSPPPPSPHVNPDGMPLVAALRRAPPSSSSTPPLLQRGLSYSVQLPPTFAAANSNPAIQQLPPACGARQLSKLKRFLTTLMQFGDDISSEVGDQVRSLILALVNSAISTEEFHAKLQETTNFPLRPFVIPFLKTNLPFLQRELLQCARLSTQYPDRYLNIPPHPLPPSHPFPQTSLHHSVDSFGPPPAKRPAPFLLPSSIPQEQHIPPFHGYPRRSAAPGTDQLLQLQQQQQLFRSVIGNGTPALAREDHDDDVDVSSETCDDTPDARGGVRNGDGHVAAASASASAVVAATDAILESRDADSPTPHPFDDRSRGESPRRRPLSDGAGDENDGGPEIERDIYYVYHLLSTVSVMMEKARLSLESIKNRNSMLSGDGRSTSELSGSGAVESEHTRSGAAADNNKPEITSHSTGVQSIASPGTSSSSSSSSDTAQDLSSYSSSNRDSAANGHSAGTSTTKNSCASKESTTASTASSGSVTSPPPRTKLSGVITEVERAIRVVETKTSALIADADSQRAKLLKRKIVRNDGGDDAAANAEDTEAGVGADAKGKEGSRSATESPSISSSALKTSLEMIVTEADDPAMFCWNCGREANETCSGCNKAKYCGSFCQHKDWEVHHKNCAQLKEATEDIPVDKCEDDDSEVKTDIDN